MCTIQVIQMTKASIPYGVGAFCVSEREEIDMSYSKIEVVTSMSHLSDLKEALSKKHGSGMTVMQVIGCGVQKGTPEYEPEMNKSMELLPKQMIVIVVEDSQVDDVIELIKKELYTGHIGDGKIFVTPVTRIIRVRTGEEGTDALR